MNDLYKTSHGRYLVALIFALVCLAGCNNDDTDFFFDLHYPGIVDIGQSMNASTGVPSYRGPEPSSFAITNVKLDDEQMDGHAAYFAIDSETGNISVFDTDDLPVGVYKISVSCVVQGRTFNYPDIVEMEMLPSVPATIEVVPSVLDISYSDPTGEESAQVTVTSSSASVTNYYLVQESGKEYFTINASGKITLNQSYTGDVLPGSYSVTVRLVTQAGQAVFAGALTVNITSAPLELTYSPAEQSMEAGLAFSSMVPVVKGSQDNLLFSISKTTPQTSELAIDPSTGVISVAEGNNLIAGQDFVVDVNVSNDFGAKDFTGVYKLSVIDFIEPISGFSYDPVNKPYATAWTAPVSAGFTGGEVNFSIVSVSNPVLDDQIKIDPSSGIVSVEKGNTIPQGDYTVKVMAENIKNSQEATLSVKIVENPYHFTSIVYGNNCGLYPEENYANQFLVFAAENEGDGPGSTTAPYVKRIPVTDIKPGIAVKWSLQIKQLGSASNIIIDEDTGELTVNYIHSSTSGNMVYITAVTGEGLPEETSVTVPVFFAHPKYMDGLIIYYKPFVFQVNPFTGGRSVTPTIKGLQPADKLVMNYRRGMTYFNFNGPASHLDGAPTVANGFLNQAWKGYYDARGININTGSQDPVKYHTNSSNPGIALAYVSPDDFSVVVNPNKWVDNVGRPASGMFYCQMTYAKDGNVTTADGSGNQIFPLYIWFDESF